MKYFVPLATIIVFSFAITCVAALPITHQFLKLDIATGIVGTAQAQVQAQAQTKPDDTLAPITSRTRNTNLNLPEVVQGEESLRSSSETNITKHTDNALVDGIATSIYFNLTGYPDSSARSEQYSNAGFSNSGLIAMLGSGISHMYGNPPATTEQYIAYMLDSAGIQIAQPAYAQVGGLGFTSLLPILDTWVKLRNLAYLFFVVLFVIIGFMIMFRRKVGTQAAITIQQALPSIVIALLAVTFSFAIAGLMIDLMYILMYLMLAVFSTDRFNPLFTGSLFDIGGNLLFGGSTGSVHNIVEMFVKNLLGGQEYALANLGGWIAGLSAAVIFAILITISLFRLFFELLQTYITILIMIVTAPLSLMMGAIPGRNPFMSWIKGLAGNLIVFPALLFVLLLYENLVKADSLYASGGGFLPPYLLGSGQGDVVTGLISIGIIMILPTIIKEAKKPFGATGGVFAAFAPAIQEAITTGWRGGELIPGVGFTNTANYGISGKSATAKAGVGAAAIGGGLLGGAMRSENRGYGVESGARDYGARAAAFFGEKNLFRKDQERLKKEKEEEEKRKQRNK